MGNLWPLHTAIHVHLLLIALYASVPVGLEQLRSKLDPKAEKCVFVGYSLEQKGYRCYNPVKRELRVSRDVVFDEMSSWYNDVSDGVGVEVKERIAQKTGQ